MSAGREAWRRGRRTGLAAAAACAILAVPGPALAQSVAAGRVLRPGATDTVPVSGVRVVLHRVASEAQGPIDSALSGPFGEFRFRFRPDSGAVYLLSARYRGIEYFSPPVPAAAAPSDTALGVLVYDTSSTAPVSLVARHVIIPRPVEDGGREVLELVILRNAGHLARVAPDSAGDSWAMPLPPGSEGLEAGESDVSSDALTRRGDSLHLTAPIGPGDKQLTLSYGLPAGMSDLAVPIGPTDGTVNVLVEEPGAAVTGPGLAAADTQVVLGRTFRRWTGEVPAGALVRVTLPRPPGNPRWLLGLLVGAVAAGLALAAWRVLRGGGRPAPSPTAPRPSVSEREALLHRLARLDAEFAGRESEVEPAAWAEYQAERARLKAELEAALAASRAPQ